MTNNLRQFAPRNPIRRLFDRLRMTHAARQLAAEVFQELRPDVLRKLPTCSSSDLRGYAQVRVAQAVHARVDQLMLARPHENGEFANRLIKSATQEAVAQIIEDCREHLKRAHRSTAA